MVDLTKKAAAGIVEGEYTSWPHQWTNDLPTALSTWGWDYFVDEINKSICIAGHDTGYVGRFGVYALSDFTQLFLSSTGSNYTQVLPDNDYNSPVHEETRTGFVFGSGRGFVSPVYWGFGLCRSYASYVLLLRHDRVTIEVWRGGSSPQWSRDITNEVAGATVRRLHLSPSGQYILILTSTMKLVLYEGV